LQLGSGVSPTIEDSVTSSAQPARRSGLVTFFAWMSIIGGAFGVLGSAPLLLAQPSTGTIVLLVDALCSFTAGLGLRARREWARRGFIFVLAYSALMALVGAYRFRLPAASELPTRPGGSAPALTPQQLDAITAQMRTPFLVMAFVSALICGLLIAWLCSRRIRYEFNPEMAPDDFGLPDAVEAVPVQPAPDPLMSRDDRASRTAWPPVI